MRRTVQVQVSLKSRGNLAVIAGELEMAKSTALLTIGEAARRCGIATSTLRFYEERGLISSVRSAGNQRLYHRAALRRISVVRVAQSLGLTLKEIGEALAELPDGRTPNKRDWERLSRKWRAHLDTRIDQLQRMRENLTECIGCGCLSLKSCALHNPGDRFAASGTGPRILLDPSAGTECGPSKCLSLFGSNAN